MAEAVATGRAGGDEQAGVHGLVERGEVLLEARGGDGEVEILPRDGGAADRACGAGSLRRASSLATEAVIAGGTPPACRASSNR